MYQRSFRHVRSDALSLVGCIFVFFLLIISYPLIYIVSLNAPPMYKEQRIKDKNSNFNGETSWEHDLDGMDRMNQQFSLQVEFTNTRYKDVGIEKNVLISVKLSGRRHNEALNLQHYIINSDKPHEYHIQCHVNSQTCVPIELLHIHGVEYPIYHVEIHVQQLGNEQSGDIYYQFNYGNPHFTVLILCVKYLFLAFVLAYIATYSRLNIRHMNESDDDNIRMNSRMLLLLLFGLILYNDPLYICHVSSNSGIVILPLLSTLFQITFFAIIAIYMLYFMETVLIDLKFMNSVYNQYENQSYMNIWVKMCIIWILWLVCACWVTFVTIKQHGDPLFNPENDINGFWIYKLCCICIIVFVCIYYAFLIIRTFSEIFDIRQSVASVSGSSSNEFKHLKRRFYMYLSLTFVLLTLLTLDGIAAYSSSSTTIMLKTTPRVMAQLVLCNVYVFVVIYLNMPISYEVFVSSSNNDYDNL